jgi:hypothetical protein
VLLIGGVERQPLAVGLGVVAEGGFDAKRVLEGRLGSEGRVRAVDGADGEVFLAVEVYLDGELACVVGGVLRFLKILEWPCRVLQTFRPTTLPTTGTL